VAFKSLFRPVGSGGSVNISAGNTSAGGSASGGDIILSSGTSGSGTLTRNGGVALVGGVTYVNPINFANLATPKIIGGVGPKGAIVFAQDAKGPQDGATWGAIAAGSGSGALVRYDGTNWRVIG